MSNIHHAIYIPVPRNIDKSGSFRAVTFDMHGNPGKTTFAWGSNPKPGQAQQEAIAEQKAGFTQIAGNDGQGGSASNLLNRMKCKATMPNKKGYTVENEIIFQSPRGGALEKLTNPDSVLYVDSHGDSQNMGYRPYGLSPRDLALLLYRHERLPTAIKAIKLFACYSGEEADTDAGTRTGDIYARQFSACMTALGYHQLTVYGYLGELIVLDNGQRVSDTARATTGSNVRASSVRFAFVNGSRA